MSKTICSILTGHLPTQVPYLSSLPHLVTFQSGVSAAKKLGAPIKPVNCRLGTIERLDVRLGFAHLGKLVATLTKKSLG
jgi:hypothetical protein